MSILNAKILKRIGHLFAPREDKTAKIKATPSEAGVALWVFSNNIFNQMKSLFDELIFSIIFANDNIAEEIQVRCESELRWFIDSFLLLRSQTIMEKNKISLNKIGQLNGAFFDFYKTQYAKAGLSKEDVDSFIYSLNLRIEAYLIAWNSYSKGLEKSIFISNLQILLLALVTIIKMAENENYKEIDKKTNDFLNYYIMTKGEDNPYDMVKLYALPLGLASPTVMGMITDIFENSSNFFKHIEII